jgi:cell wall-associated NlpC family hydrolase
VLPAVARRLARGLRACVGSRWRVGVSLDTLAEQASWHAPRAGLTRLWRAHPERRLELATEWLPSDGPLSVLAHVRGAWLLRAADGSAGWTHDEPERARTSAPPAGRAVGQDWAAAARAFLGVPYRFGGTMGDGVDCSGLVQRLHRQVRGAVLPRHSRDQLVSRGRSRPQRSGDIVSLAAHADGAHHVGLALWTPRAGWSVVHASTTRGRVVEEALEDYLGAGQPEVE